MNVKNIFKGQRVEKAAADDEKRGGLTKWQERGREKIWQRAGMICYQIHFVLPREGD